VRVQYVCTVGRGAGVADFSEGCDDLPFYGHPKLSVLKIGSCKRRSVAHMNTPLTACSSVFRFYLLNEKAHKDMSVPLPVLHEVVQVQLPQRQFEVAAPLIRSPACRPDGDQALPRAAGSPPAAPPDALLLNKQEAADDEPLLIIRANPRK
jgi:hypothetical protein